LGRLVQRLRLDTVGSWRHIPVRLFIPD
jgi:hypothetical protein